MATAEVSSRQTDGNGKLSTYIACGSLADARKVFERDIKEREENSHDFNPRLLRIEEGVGTLSLVCTGEREQSDQRGWRADATIDGQELLLEVYIPKDGTGENSTQPVIESILRTFTEEIAGEVARSRGL